MPLTHLITAIGVALVCVGPTALIALVFGIHRDGSPFRKEFWS